MIQKHLLHRLVVPPERIARSTADRLRSFFHAKTGQPNLFMEVLSLKTNHSNHGCRRVLALLLTFLMVTQ